MRTIMAPVSTVDHAANNFHGICGKGSQAGFLVEWCTQHYRHLLAVKPQGSKRLIVAVTATERIPGFSARKSRNLRMSSLDSSVRLSHSKVIHYQFKRGTQERVPALHENMDGGNGNQEGTAKFGHVNPGDQASLALHGLPPYSCGDHQNNIKMPALESLNEELYWAVPSPSASEVSDSHRDPLQTVFEILPWEDVIFMQIFRCLPLNSLFHIRGLSHMARTCVDQYFSRYPKVDLTLISKRFTAAAFQTVLCNNTMLQSLILRNCKDWLVDDVMKPVLLHETHLKEVDLTSCSSLSSMTVLRLATNAPKLQELYLRDCQWLSKEASMTVAMNCPMLQRLDLTGCWNLDDETIIAVSIHCKKLRYLSISKIYGITDYAVRSLALNCPELQHVNMHGCWRVTDNTIQLLGEYCHQLRGLQVRDCREITEVSLAKLRRKGVKVDIPQHPWRMSQSTSLFLQRLNLQV